MAAAIFPPRHSGGRAAPHFRFRLRTSEMGPAGPECRQRRGSAPGGGEDPSTGHPPRPSRIPASIPDPSIHPGPQHPSRIPASILDPSIHPGPQHPSRSQHPSRIPASILRPPCTLAPILHPPAPLAPPSSILHPLYTHHAPILHPLYTHPAPILYPL
ncbi:hypothetical protein HGM15179_006454 [Zosterops borbonicus]|uniref:Uncharacterized protein n=1 Tax=Zosterops borbonicus TaxID=364589 RepID=A0A8K1GKI6_9PASS|nr:hypothetical protein HGM15179_006454 [Zosterops borbonicus]